jgi:hypothetical protein
VVNVISALSMHSANFGRSIFQSFGGVFSPGSSIEPGARRWRDRAHYHRVVRHHHCRHIAGVDVVRAAVAGAGMNITDLMMRMLWAAVIGAMRGVIAGVIKPGLALSTYQALAFLAGLTGFAPHS